MCPVSDLVLVRKASTCVYTTLVALALYYQSQRLIRNLLILIFLGEL